MLTNQEIITKMNSNSQNQRLRLFAKVDISTKLKILALQKQQFHELKSAYSDVDNTILTLSSLLLAIDAIEKEFTVDDAKDLFKSAGIDSRATTVTGLEKSLSKATDEQKEALKALVNPTTEDIVVDPSEV